jgi:DNA recombination protein Rad52
MSDVSEIKKRLDEKIPRDVVKKREGSGGKKFDYLEGWYVIARLNEVLGQGNWGYMTEEIRCVRECETERGFTCHYIARVRLETPGLGGPHGIFADVGYGDGTDRGNPGKAHELAAKEAVTDALKRCAKNLGMSMGLALYDKTQENVDDGETEEQPRRGANGNGRAGKEGTGDAPAAKAPAGRAAAKEAAPVGDAADAAGKGSVTEAPPEDRDQLNSLLGSLSKVVIAKKRKTLPELKALLKETYGAEGKEDLSDEQAREFYGTLREMIA